MRAQRILGGMVVLGVALAACSDDEDDTADSVVAAAADASPLVFVGGEAAALALPDGLPGEVSVISRSTEVDRFGQIHFVIRNMTADTVGHVDLETTLIDRAGQVIAIGEDPYLQPDVIRPGEIGFGYLYFSDLEHPDAVEAEVRVVGWDGASASDVETDLAITQARVEGDALVGTITNSGDEPAPVSAVRGICFDDEGVPYVDIYGPLVLGSIEPGATVSFSEIFPDADRCAVFLAALVE